MRNKQYGVFVDGKAVSKTLLTLSEAYSMCEKIRAGSVKTERICWRFEGGISTHRYRQLNQLKRRLRNAIDDVTDELQARYTELIRRIKIKQSKHISHDTDRLGDYLTQLGY